MNWIIPFSPVFSKTTGVPPVRVESSVSKPCDFSPEVGPGVKNTEKHGEPQIRHWDPYLKSVNEYTESILIVKMLN